MPLLLLLQHPLFEDKAAAGPITIWRCCIELSSCRVGGRALCMQRSCQPPVGHRVVPHPHPL